MSTLCKPKCELAVRQLPPPPIDTERRSGTAYGTKRTDSGTRLKGPSIKDIGCGADLLEARTNWFTWVMYLALRFISSKLCFVFAFSLVIAPSMICFEYRSLTGQPVGPRFENIAGRSETRRHENGELGSPARASIFSSSFTNGQISLALSSFPSSHPSSRIHHPVRRIT